MEMSHCSKNDFYVCTIFIQYLIHDKVLLFLLFHSLFKTKFNSILNDKLFIHAYGF